MSDNKNKRKGFSSLDQRKNDYEYPKPLEDLDRNPYIRHSVSSNIPWRIIFIIVAVLVLLIFLWIFREEITLFLTQLVVWVIIIVALVYIVKRILFGRKRW